MIRGMVSPGLEPVIELGLLQGGDGHHHSRRH